MSNDQPSRRPPAKSSGGGAPMGSTISIVIAVVAVVVGFLILRNITDDGSSAGSGGPTGPITTAEGSTPDSAASSDPATPTTAPISATPTTMPLVFSPGKVVVANASGVGGAAGLASKALTTVGFTMGDATDAAGAEQKIALTKVYFQAGSEAVAQSVAQAFGAPDSGVVIAAMPTPIPVKNATIGDATVLVMVGTDFAGKPLPILASTTETTAAATAITTVAPAGDTTTTGG